MFLSSVSSSISPLSSADCANSFVICATPLLSTYSPSVAVAILLVPLYTFKFLNLPFPIKVIFALPSSCISYVHN